MKKDGTAPLPAVIRGLAVALALAVSATALADHTGTVASSTRPPKTGRWVGDHWTPWDPPTPPDGARVYLIQKGDTLWDTAQKDLGDPYLWPRIWDQNRYILDSHWIYPGDPLVMPGPVTVVAEETSPPEVPAEEEVAETAMVPPEEPEARPRHSPWGKPHPDDAADYSDLICSGYILPEHWEGDTWIYAGEEEGKTGYSPGDVVYINRGLTHGIRPGDRFFVVHEESEVKHPLGGDRIGWYVRRMAVARVIAAQAETSTVELAEGCDTVHIGYDLVPYVEPVPPKRRETNLARYGVEDNGRTKGYLVFAEDGQWALGQRPLSHSALSQRPLGEGDIVHIDLGQQNGLKPGDYLMIYRERVTGQNPNEAGFINYRYAHKSTIPAFNTRKIEKGQEIPRHMLGEMIILATEQNTATAKITYSWREIYKGDQVQLLN